MMQFPDNFDDFDSLAAFVVLFSGGRGGISSSNAHPGPVGDGILQETGIDFILQENGDYILQEGP